MIRIHNQTQMTLEGFETPFERQMDKNNRWVKLGGCIPWDDFSEACYQSFSAKIGRPAKSARLVIGAVIIIYKNMLISMLRLFLSWQMRRASIINNLRLNIQCLGC